MTPPVQNDVYFGPENCQISRAYRCTGCTADFPIQKKYFLFSGKWFIRGRCGTLPRLGGLFEVRPGFPIYDGTQVPFGDFEDLPDLREGFPVLTHGPHFQHLFFCEPSMAFEVPPVTDLVSGVFRCRRPSQIAEVVIG